MNREPTADTAARHRAAAVFELGCVSAAIASLAAVFSFDVVRFALTRSFPVDVVPDATWRQDWLDGAMTIAQQQYTAATQWLQVVVLFASLAIGIALVNAVVAIAAHANERRYETALRAVVGASIRQLKRAARREALLDGTAGGALGAVCGTVLALVLRSYWHSDTNGIWAFPLMAIAATLAIATLASRILARKWRRAGWLGDAVAPEARSIPGFGTEDLRALLATAQIASAVALSIVSVLVWSYSTSLPSERAAAHPDRYVARVAEARNYRDAESRLQSAFGPNAAIASPGALLGLGKRDRIVSECGRCSRGNLFVPLFPVETQHHVVGASFFDVAGVAVQTGSEFLPGELSARGVVVSDTFAREAFPRQQPLGKRILVGGLEHGKWYRVIGVVADVRPFTPAIYFDARTHEPRVFDVIVNSASKPKLAGFSFEPLEQVLADASTVDRNFARSIAAFTVVLLLAASAGVFTTISMNVRSRDLEIFVRKAVGATRRSVQWLVYRDVIVRSAKAVLAGGIASIALTRALDLAIPGLPPFRLAVTLVVGVAFLTLALAAAAMQRFR